MASSRNDDNRYVKCIECKYTKALFQWFQNPVIALCKISHERQVAETERLCKNFTRLTDGKLPPIQHFDSYDVSGIGDNE